MQKTFIVQDEKNETHEVFNSEIEARGALEDFYIRNRKHNWYIFSVEGKKITEISRRVRSHRFGHPGVEKVKKAVPLYKQIQKEAKEIDLMRTAARLGTNKTF